MSFANLNILKIKKRINQKFSSFYKIYPPKLPIALIDDIGMINYKYNFIYFRIKKAANSTIVATLYNAETSKQINSLKELQYIKDNYYIKPSDLSKNEVKKISNYYCFSFVRNPYSRILSSYLNKIKLNEDEKGDNIARFLGKESYLEVSFEDFLTYLENGGIYKNAHWAKQYDLLPIPLEDFNYIGKTENLNQDLTHVLEEIFGKPYPIISVKEHGTGASQLIKEIRYKTKKRIYELYRSDFDIFGYAF